MLLGSTGVKFKGILLYQYVFHGLDKVRLPAATYSMQRIWVEETKRLTKSQRQLTRTVLYCLRNMNWIVQHSVLWGPRLGRLPEQDRRPHTRPDTPRNWIHGSSVMNSIDLSEWTKTKVEIYGCAFRAPRYRRRGTSRR